MTRAAFLLGYCLGVASLLFWIARSIGTAAEEERPYVPQDVYVEQLADILRQEAW
jgi:hypothetical protein